MEIWKYGNMEIPSNRAKPCLMDSRVIIASNVS